MKVLNWAQSRLHGAHHSKKKSEFSAGSARLANASSGLPRNDELHNSWPAAMLSIGTFGTSEGRRPKSCDGFDGSYTAGVDELQKLQEELTVLVRAKGVTTTEELDMRHHLPLKRTLNSTSSSKNGGGIARQRSFMKLVTKCLEWLHAQVKLQGNDV